MKNAALAYKVLDYIKAHPEEWDQRNWHCGTTHCFGGFVEMFATGEKESWESTWVVAEEALGIDVIDASMLFSEHNTLMNLSQLIKMIFGPRPNEEKQ